MVLDNNISDLSIEDVIGRLSISPIENKKCNTILTLDKTYKFKITTKLTKINEVILKPIIDNKLSNLIREMALEYYTPDLEYGDVDLLLQALNLNCMSSGYKYMKEAIIYCYYSLIN